MKKAVEDFKYLFPYLHLYLSLFKIKKIYHFKLESLKKKKCRAFLDGKMIWLSQLALEGCSIIFPIHEVYNKSTYYSCSPGLGVPPTHPLPDLETHKALPENWQSRSEPGAELPPPPPNEQNRVKLVCCRAGSRVDEEQLQYLSINYTVLSTPPREVTNHKKDTLH